VQEPLEGLHSNHETGSGLLGSALKRHLAELKALPADELVARRQDKFRKIARCYTEG
jgi:acetyl-CoA carboxylase carboxyl transferase subunit alpha